MAKNTPRNAPYQVITDRIVAALESGLPPWRKPWFGGNVRAGQRGTPVTFWNWREMEEGGEVKKIPFLKYYTVFNVEQCEGLEGKLPEIAAPPTFNHDPIANAEAIAAAMPNQPIITSGGGRAYYSPGRDLVNVPKAERFEFRQEYYSTLFHELAHSTGHASRLNRNMGDAFGSHAYSKEELVAEITAAYLCGQAGFVDVTLDNSAAYINSWLKALKNDRRLIVGAACQAQKAADYILGRAAQAEEPAPLAKAA